ncbi:MAG: hypothetical protein IT453_19650 [Planctomycetes bacterium]|nr:hypothetical protein [Planctomycetota bacterium]
MLEHSTRRLSESERRVLRATLTARRKQLSSALLRSLGATGVLCGGLCVLTSWASGVRAPIVVLAWAVIAVVIAAWSNISTRRELGVTIRALEDVLARDEAHVVHIRASAVVELAEVDDEGACFAFQVDERRIVFVCGRDFHASAKFPNDDFSLVEVRDARGALVESLIAKHGAKTAPARTIPARTRRSLIVPEHLATVEGRIEELERLLAASDSTRSAA